MSRINVGDKVLIKPWDDEQGTVVELKDSTAYYDTVVEVNGVNHAFSREDLKNVVV